MLWKRNIQDQVDDWMLRDRSLLYLLSGARVAEARRWLESSADEFASQESEFFKASIAAEDAGIAREQAREEKLPRLARQLFAGVVAACVLALIAFGMGGVAWFEMNKADAKAKVASEEEIRERNARKDAEEAREAAEYQAQVATSRQLAALSTSERNKRLDRSLLLAVEALHVAESFPPKDRLEARESLLKALQDRVGLTSFLHITEGYVHSVAISPDGKTIAAGYGTLGSGGGVVLWSEKSRERVVPDPLVVREGSVLSVALSPDGKTIAAGYGTAIGVARGGVVLWDVVQHTRLPAEPFSVKEGSVTSVTFSPDGKTIAAGYGFLGAEFVVAGVVLWNIGGRTRVKEDPLPVREGQVWSVAFSPDGKTIAAGYDSVVGAGGVSPGAGGGIVRWDTIEFKRLKEDPLLVKEGGLRSVCFSPDSKTIAAGYTTVIDRGGRRRGGVVLFEATGETIGTGPPPG